MSRFWLLSFALSCCAEYGGFAITTRIGLAFWRFTRAVFSGKVPSICHLAGFVELERVGQADAVEGQVVAPCRLSCRAGRGRFPRC